MALVLHDSDYRFRTLEFDIAERWSSACSVSMSQCSGANWSDTSHWILGAIMVPKTARRASLLSNVA